MSEMVIALKGDDPNPLFYISTHGGFSSKPSVVLHSDRYKSSPPIATADFPSFTSKIEIDIKASPLFAAERITLTEHGVFYYSRRFTFTLPGTNIKEQFEWKRSSGQEVANLMGKPHGGKLVRVKTGEVVAAWTLPRMLNKKKGKMSFLGNREVLGEKFELMAVISILGIMEKERRRRR